MTDQRRSERPTRPSPTHTTPEPISPAYGHATAVKRPSPPPPTVPHRCRCGATNREDSAHA